MTIQNGLLGQISALDVSPATERLTESLSAPATNVTSIELNAVPGGNSQVRLTFTSAEVGNGNTRDSNTMPNQDGGFAVRAQGEDATGNLTGAVSRFGDEAVQFIGANDAVRFDVRDLVSGVARGDTFQAVQLGTQARDFFDHRDDSISYYVNAGMGADTIQGGRGNDFLVGGAGNDALNGNSGNDSFIGGGGDDAMLGGSGNDTAIFNVVSDGADRANLGSGLDRVNVAGTGVTQVRLTFTSAEVGNNAAIDSNGMGNQDGDLAVRLQAEDSAGDLTGAVSRVDDEGISFVSTTAGLTFDVRDLVSGVARGNGFSVVQLGTAGNETITHSTETRAVYVNAGMGNDNLIGGSANDFLVGGGGSDAFNGGMGDDSLIGGGGADRFDFRAGSGDDTILDFVSGTDRINLRALNIDRDDVDVTVVGSDTFITGDSNGNGDVDFTIRLVNTTSFADSDFVF